MCLDGFGHPGSVCAGSRHHKGARFREARVIECTHHCGTHDSVKLQDACLDFGRRDPDAADLHHVVSSPEAGIGAIRIADVRVAGGDEAAVQRPAILIGAVPIAGHDRRACNVQRSRHAVTHLVAVGITQRDLIPVERRAAGARHRCAWSVRYGDMGDLGRAQTVEDLDPEALPEAPAELRRQRFAA